MLLAAWLFDWRCSQFGWSIGVVGALVGWLLLVIVWSASWLCEAIGGKDILHMRDNWKEGHVCI